MITLNNLEEILQGLALKEGESIDGITRYFVTYYEKFEISVTISSSKDLKPVELYENREKWQTILVLKNGDLFYQK